MKKVVGISLGGEQEDFEVRARFLGQSFEVRRVGANGRKAQAAKLLAHWQHHVDAVGLGFAPDGLRPPAGGAKVPVTSGLRLGEILQEWALRDTQMKLGS